MPLSEKNIRNIFIYIVPRFINYGLYLLTLPVFTRLLTPEDFGIVTLAGAFPVITVGIVTSGLVNSVARYYFEYRNDSNKLNSLYFSTQFYLFTMLIVSTFLVFTGKDYISKLILGKTDYGMAILIIYLTTYMNTMNTLYLRIYQNMERAALHSLFVLLQAIGGITASLLLVWFVKMSYMGLIYGQFFGTLFSWAIISVHFNRRVHISFNKAILFENIKYGLQVVPKAFTGHINKFFDKYMLNAVLSMSSAGIYNIGQSLSNVFFALMGNVWQALQPVYYREVFDNGEKASISVGRIFSIFSYITLFPITIGLLFAQEVIEMVFPSSYHGAIDIVLILGAATATQTFGMYVSVQYAYSKKPFWLFPVSVFGNVLNVALNICLIPKYGLVGAGIATAASMVCVNIFLFCIGQRLYKIEYEWKILACFYLNILGVLAATLFLRRIDIGDLYLYLIKFSLLFTYFYLGIKSDIVSIKLIKNSIQSLSFFPQKNTS